jgi:hypothetical protein
MAQIQSHTTSLTDDDIASFADAAGISHDAWTAATVTAAGLLGEGLTAAESAAIVNEVRSLFRGGVAAAVAEAAALQREVHRQVEAVTDAELMALAHTLPWLLGVGHAPTGSPRSIMPGAAPCATILAKTPAAGVLNSGAALLSKVAADAPSSERASFGGAVLALPGVPPHATLRLSNLVGFWNPTQFSLFQSDKLTDCAGNFVWEIMTSGEFRRWKKGSGECKERWDIEDNAVKFALHEESKALGYSSGDGWAVHGHLIQRNDGWALDSSSSHDRLIWRKPGEPEDAKIDDHFC